MWVPKWLLWVLGVYLFFANYVAAKYGLVMILSDMGVL